ELGKAPSDEIDRFRTRRQRKRAAYLGMLGKLSAGHGCKDRAHVIAHQLIGHPLHDLPSSLTGANLSPPRAAATGELQMISIVGDGGERALKWRRGEPSWPKCLGRSLALRALGERSGI